MVEYEKEHGVMGLIKDWLSYTAKIIAASVFPPIADGAEMVMKTIENRILRIQRRMLTRLFSFLIMGIGGILLILALFFFMREFLGWSNAAAFLSVGIIVFVIGLLIKLGESDK